MQAVTAKDHLGLNIGFFSALLFMVLFLKHGHYRYLGLSAVAFGLMLGYKLSGPVYPLISGAIFLWLVYRNRRPIFAVRGERLRLVRALGVCALVILSLGGYWYGKNLFLYGDLQGRYTVAESRAVHQKAAAEASPADTSPADTAGPAPEPAAALPKAPTGIDGVDTITRGGLPRGRPTLVAGGAGCGKNEDPFLISDRGIPLLPSIPVGLNLSPWVESGQL